MVTAPAHWTLAAAVYHRRLKQALERRCLYLFYALIGMLIASAFVAHTAGGRLVIGLLNSIVLVAAVAAAERTRASLLVAALLAVAAFSAQVIALETGSQGDFALFWGVAAVFYAFTIVRLLRYVLHRDALTADKLYGAVAAYMMIALLWAFVFGVLQYFYPGSYALHGFPKVLDLSELIFFSFTVLTTAGFGDITPVLTPSRFLTIIEAVSGVMYVAILIARLTGVYPVQTPKQ